MQDFFGVAQLGRFGLGWLSGGIVSRERLNPRDLGGLGKCDAFYRPIGRQAEADGGMGVIRLAAGPEGARVGRGQAV